MRTGKIPCDYGGRDWNDVAASQGAPRADSRHQKVGRGKEDSGFHPESQREHGPGDTSISDFWHPKVGQKKTSVLLSYPNFGTLLWQP